MVEFYWELDKAARRILQAISLALSLTEVEKEKLFDLHSGDNNQLRLLHYPSISTEKLRKNVVARMPTHRDWRYVNRVLSLSQSFFNVTNTQSSTFTMLFQDDCGGLEFEDPNHAGLFVPATPVPGTLALNIGDMLQRFSNGTLFLSLWKLK